MGSNPPCRMGAQCLVVQAAKGLLLWDGGRSLPEGMDGWIWPGWVIQGVGFQQGINQRAWAASLSPTWGLGQDLSHHEAVHHLSLQPQPAVSRDLSHWDICH